MIGFVHILSELFLYQIIIVFCSNKNPGIEVCVYDVETKGSPVQMEKGQSILIPLFLLLSSRKMSI